MTTMHWQQWKLCFPYAEKWLALTFFGKIVIIRSIFVRKGCSLTENQICVIFNTHRTINWLFVAVCHFKKVHFFFRSQYLCIQLNGFFCPVVQTYENCLIDMSHNGYNFDFSTLFSCAFFIFNKYQNQLLTPLLDNRFICFYWK